MSLLASTAITIEVTFTDRRGRPFASDVQMDVEVYYNSKGELCCIATCEPGGAEIDYGSTDSTELAIWHAVENEQDRDGSTLNEWWLQHFSDFDDSHVPSPPIYGVGFRGGKYVA